MSGGRLVVATSFGVFPPRGGGQARIFGLYGALARLGVGIDIVALVDGRERPRTREIAPGVRETRVPRSSAHEAAEAALSARAGIPVGDLSLAMHHELTPAYAEAVRARAAAASAVIASHPFAFPALEDRAGAPLLFEAHNVEADLKAAMLADSPAADELIGVVREVEAACCREAAHVTVCSTQDAERLTELYGLTPDRTVLVPNGVDVDGVPFVGLEERRRRQTALGMASRRHALFIGSWHEPNLVAVRDVIAAAHALPEVRFLVVGSAGLPFSTAEVPGNVDLCGIVAHGFIRDILGVVDAAMNPMRWGSGTNLKMLDYALAGAPLVSSRFGARGLGLAAGRDYLPVEPDDLADGLHRLFGEADEEIERRIGSARERALDFSWSVLAAQWRADERLERLLDGAAATR